MIPGQNIFQVSGEGYSTIGEIKHVGGTNLDLDHCCCRWSFAPMQSSTGKASSVIPTEGA